MRIDRKSAQAAILSAAVVAALSHTSVTLAADKFWDGTFNNSWTHGPNWFGGEPGSGDRARFDAAPSVNLNLVFLHEDRFIADMAIDGIPAPGTYEFSSFNDAKLFIGNQLMIAGIDANPTPVTFNGFNVDTGQLLLGANGTLNLVGSTNKLFTANGMEIFGALNWQGGSISQSFGSTITVNSGALMNVTAGGRGLGDGASLHVIDGQFTSTSYFDIGASFDVGNGPTGSLLVSGSNARYQVGGAFSAWGANFGDVADVVFANQSIGTLSAGVDIATSGGTAFVDVIGGARLHVGDHLTIGMGAPPPLTSGVRTNIAGPNLAGTPAGGGGTLTVDAGTLTSVGTTTVGGGGSLIFNNGAIGTMGTLRLAPDGGAAFLGVNSNSNVTAAVISAGNITPVGALSTVNVSGGTLETQSNAQFFDGSTVNLSGGTLKLGGQGAWIGNSTLNWSGGKLVTTPGTTLIVQDGAQVNVTAGGRGLSNNTTLNVIDGGKFTSTDYFDIGSSLDAGNGPVGTLLVSGSNSQFVVGGNASAWGHRVGDAATVTFSSSSVGTLSAVQLATGGARSLLTLNGNASLNVQQQMIVGGNVASVATINLGNATLNVGNADVRRGATLNQTAGQFLMNGNSTFSTGSTFNWSGGTWNNAAGTTIAFEGGTGSFTGGNAVVGRALSNGSTLRIGPGGTLKTDSFFDIADGTTGTMIVDGGLFEATSPAAGTNSVWGDGGGTATISILNGGTAIYGRGVSLRGGTVNLQSGGHLRAGFFNIDAPATVNIAGGALITNLSAASTGFASGAVVNYSAGTFNVAGTVTTSGNSQILLTSGGNKVLRAGGLSMSNTSKIDLNDNDMIVGALTPKSTVENLVRVARNGGTWDGPAGITSTAAKNASPSKNTTLGILSGAEYSSVGGNGTFSGQSYSATDTLVKYTWYGDTDFNGVVNFDDYSRTDNGFNENLTGWLNGDLDYSGTVNFDDYGLIDLAFNTQGGTVLRASQFLDGSDRSMNGMTGDGLAMVVQHFNEFGQSYASSFLTAVPEPSAIALLAPVGTMLARRRRKS